MTETFDPPPDIADAIDRVQYGHALARVALFLVANPDVPLPGRHFQIPAPVLARDAQAEWLRQVADALGVPVVKRDGCLFAERQIGPITLSAHIRDIDYTQVYVRRLSIRLGRRQPALKKGGKS